MKKGTKWVLGTAGTLVAVGLILRGVGFVMGGGRESRQYYEGRLEEFRWDWGSVKVSPDGISVGGENGIQVDSSGVSIGGEQGIHVEHHSSERGEKKQYVESGALTGITGIDVEIDCGDIYLQEGEECSVSMDWNLSNYAISYWVEDGVLKVEDESWGISGIEHGFSITSQIVLTVPAGMELDRLHLSTNMGDIEAEASLAAQKAELSTDLGDVTSRGLRVWELEAESDLGDVTVRVPEEYMGLGYSLSTDLGEILVNGRGQAGSEHEASVRSGKMYCEGEGEYFVKAESSLGNVVLEYPE